MQPTTTSANPNSELSRALIVERDPSRRDTIVEAFLTRGFAVTPVDSVDEASRWIESDAVDLVVADLKSAAYGDSQLMRAVRKQRAVVPVVLVVAGHDVEAVESLRDGTTDILRSPFSDQEIDRVIERALAARLKHTDTLKVLPFASELIEFVLPSRVEYLDGILNYLTERLVKMGVMHPQSTNVIIALDEAIVNAIKHGNGYDENKKVTVVAEITAAQARFTVTDEGPGFSVSDVPDPCAPENLLRTSGRGLLLIRNIMDELSFNERGNSLTMVKRAETGPEGSINTPLSEPC